MKTIRIRPISYVALVVAVCASATAISANAEPMGGPPGQREVLLVNAECFSMFPGGPRQASLSMTGSGTVTGASGNLRVPLANAPGSCLLALAGVPQALADAGCASGGISGDDNGARVAGVCEGARATLISTAANLTRAFLGF